MYFIFREKAHFMTVSFLQKNQKNKDATVLMLPDGNAKLFFKKCFFYLPIVSFSKHVPKDVTGAHFT
jgi:hypothetical protein